MKRKIGRTSIVCFFCMFVLFPINAKNFPDSIVMSVGDKLIPLSEFLYIANKNGEADFSSKKSLNEYVELFKIFKLKVMDAESKGLDKTKAFLDEYQDYCDQLETTYLSDKEYEESVAKELYDRSGYVLDLSFVFFRFPIGRVLMNDTLAAYQKAKDIYIRLKKGEDIDEVGFSLSQSSNREITYRAIHGFQPMRMVEKLEKELYQLSVDEISRPIRTGQGYYIAKVHNRRPNEGTIQVAHILIGYPDSVDEAVRMKTLEKAKNVYQQLQSGEDFGELAKKYSTDNSATNGGVLPPFKQGTMVYPFEIASFALQTPGETSGLIETPFGFHIIQLIAREPRRSFEDEKEELIVQMQQGERIFELNKGINERLKREYNYSFSSQAYKELETLCNDFYPNDKSFLEEVRRGDKTLFSLNGMDYSQSVFAEYMQNSSAFSRMFAGDFMEEMYSTFLQELMLEIEKKNIPNKYPEYNHLIQEYRDGILLFEISNEKVWTKPSNEQAELESAWIKELKKKYPVVLNKKALKKLLE